MTERNKEAWQEFIKDSVPAASRHWRFLNEDVAKRSKSFTRGIYIYTTEAYWLDRDYKIGLTTVGPERCYQQSGASNRDGFVIVDFIDHQLEDPNSGGFDRRYDQIHIHQRMQDNFGTTWLNSEDAPRIELGIEIPGGREWSRFPDDNPTYLVRKAIQKSDGDHRAGRINFLATIPQHNVVEAGLGALNDGHKVCQFELCARFGKTPTALTLFKFSKKKILVVTSYVLSVLSSFENDITRFDLFSDLKLLDSAAATFTEELQAAVSRGEKVVVLVSLHQSKETKLKLDSLRKAREKIFWVDEADFGAHRERQKEFIAYLQGSDESPIILASGTGADRAASDYNPTFVTSYTYFDMLADKASDLSSFESQIKGLPVSTSLDHIVPVNFFQVAFDRLVCDADDFGDELPSWSKVCEEPFKAKGFLTSFIEHLFKAQGYLEYFNLDYILGEAPRGVMVFLPRKTKKTNLTKIIGLFKEILHGTDWEVYELSGNVTNNRKAEQLIKSGLKKSGKRPLIISAQMGERSFSMPEVDTVILAYDNGSAALTMQRLARSLTMNGPDKIAKVISASFDPNRDDKIDDVILEAAQRALTEQSPLDGIKAEVRRILRTINILRLHTNGDLESDRIVVVPDEYTEQLVSLSNLPRIVGKSADLRKLFDMPDLLDKLTQFLQNNYSRLGISKVPVIKGGTYATTSKPAKKKSKAGGVNDDVEVTTMMVLNAIANIAERARYINIIAGCDNLTNSLDLIQQDAAKEQMFLESFLISPDLLSDLLNHDIISLPLMEAVADQQRVESKNKQVALWGDGTIPIPVEMEG